MTTEDHDHYTLPYRKAKRRRHGAHRGRPPKLDRLISAISYIAVLVFAFGAAYLAVLLYRSLL